MALIVRTVLLLALSLQVFPALAWTHGSADAPSGINGFNVLALGPGEQITSVNIECNTGFNLCNGSGSSTKVVRTDTAYGWIFNLSVNYCGNSYVGAPSKGCWTNLVTPATMPNGVVPGSGNSIGVYELITAPSNTNHAYMIWSGDGCLYTTTNLAGVAAIPPTAKWVPATQPSGACLPYDNGVTADAINRYQSNTGAYGSKFFHYFISVDPHDENTVLVSTPGNQGSYYSQNGGVSSWVKITAIGNGGVINIDGGGGGAVFAFDRTSWSSGDTPGIYACVYGNGVWHTSTGVTGTWLTVPGTAGTMPTECREMEVDGAGKLWIIDDNNSGLAGGKSTPIKNVDTYTPGTTTWNLLTNLSTNQSTFVGLAIDYNNCSVESSCHIVIGDQGGGLFKSITGDASSGSGFSTRSPASGGSINTTANDVPWLGPSFTGITVNLSPGNVVFDMAQSNVVDMPVGFGYLEASIGSLPTTNLALTTETAGLAQFNNIQTIMPNGIPLVSVYDHGVVVMASPGAYPSTVGNGIDGNIDAGWGISSAPATPAFATLLGTGAGNTSGTTANNGGSWTAWPHTPTEIQTPGTGNITAPGGSIAASTTTNWVLYPGDDGDLYYTPDGGTTWTLVCPGSGTGVACGGLAQTSSSGTPTTLSFSSVPSQVQTGFNTNSYGYNVVDATACPNDPAITLTGVTSTTITIASRLCPLSGSNVAANDYIWIRPSTGWTQASYYHDHRVCADTAGNGTFYALYDGQGTPGIWASTNGGVAWNLAYNGQLNGGSNATGAFISCVPGNTLDMYAGEDGGGSVTNHSFYECTSNGGSPPTITCKTITAANGYGAAITNVTALCFGKAKTGSYPAIYFVGTVGATYSVWQTNDHFQTFTNVQTLAGVTPYSTYDTASSCAGDMTTYGSLIVGMQNTNGYWITGLPYLLKRDLDPASNDDTPLGLNKAA